MALNQYNKSITERKLKQQLTELPIGTSIKVNERLSNIPDGVYNKNGTEYRSSDFPILWNDYLTTTPSKLDTCSYDDYENEVSTYGFCDKFGVFTNRPIPTCSNKNLKISGTYNGTSEVIFDFQDNSTQHITTSRAGLGIVSDGSYKGDITATYEGGLTHEWFSFSSDYDFSRERLISGSVGFAGFLSPSTFMYHIGRNIISCTLFKLSPDVDIFLEHSTLDNSIILLKNTYNDDTYEIELSQLASFNNFKLIFNLINDSYYNVDAEIKYKNETITHRILSNIRIYGFSAAFAPEDSMSSSYLDLAGSFYTDSDGNIKPFWVLDYALWNPLLEDLGLSISGWQYEPQRGDTITIDYVENKNWYKNNEVIDLSTFGLSVIGTPKDGDTIDIKLSTGFKIPYVPTGKDYIVLENGVNSEVVKYFGKEVGEDSVPVYIDKNGMVQPIDVRKQKISLTPSSSNITIGSDSNSNIYYLDMKGSTTINLESQKNFSTFELCIKMPTAYSITFPSEVKWLDNEAPDMSEVGVYYLVFRYDNIVGNWYANLQGMWSL